MDRLNSKQIIALDGILSCLMALTEEESLLTLIHALNLVSEYAFDLEHEQDGNTVYTVESKSTRVDIVKHEVAAEPSNHSTV